MFLRLDMPTVRDVISREELPESETSVHSRGIAVGETTVGLLSACSRLIELHETPEDIPFLSHLIQREIVYRILSQVTVCVPLCFFPSDRTMSTNVTL
jgi:AraC-type transcriptional regulator N-terminus